MSKCNGGRGGSSATHGCGERWAVLGLADGLQWVVAERYAVEKNERPV